MKHELLAMQLDFVVFALEKGIETLPTGENPIDLLKRISEVLKEEEPARRGRPRKEQAVA